MLAGVAPNSLVIEWGTDDLRGNMGDLTVSKILPGLEARDRHRCARRGGTVHKTRVEDH